MHAKNFLPLTNKGTQHSINTKCVPKRLRRKRPNKQKIEWHCSVIHKYDNLVKQNGLLSRGGGGGRGRAGAAVGRGIYLLEAIRELVHGGGWTAQLTDCCSAALSPAVRNPDLHSFVFS